MAEHPHGVAEILDGIEREAENGPRLSVDTIVEGFGTRGHGPFLLVPALIEISPIGAVPGIPTVLASIVAVFAVQILAGREHLWLPSFIRRRSVSSEKAKRAVTKLRPIAHFCDRWFHGRLRPLTRRPFVQIAAAACIALALTVPFLEVLPLASSAPMAAIAMFGLALLVRDGLLMVLASMLTALALYVISAVVL